MMKDETTCIRCALCASRCPTHAILMKHFDFSPRLRHRPHAQSQGAVCVKDASACRACASSCTLRSLMPLELGLVFLLGLVSSLHCVQMCGPIVLAFSLPLKRSDAAARPPAVQRRAHPHLRLPGSDRRSGRAAVSACWAAWRAWRPARASSRAAAMIVAGILMVGLLPSNGLVTIQNRGITKRHRPAPARAEGQVHSRTDPRLPPVRPGLCRAAEGGGFRQRRLPERSPCWRSARAPRWRCSPWAPPLPSCASPAGAIASRPSR